MHSGIYRGEVTHVRMRPVRHEFRYSLFQLYLDLDELPHVFDGSWLWSAQRPALAWFRREDHLGPAGTSLADSVRDEVERQTGSRPTGPIRVLTNLRYFGWSMNPVSYFYCFAPQTGELQSVLAEVHNTPWGERHCYVVSNPVDRDTGSPRRVQTRKEFHVSPFMRMEQTYDWRIHVPDTHLRLSIAAHEREIASDRLAESPDRTAGTRSTLDSPGAPLFSASLNLVREEISAARLRNLLLRFPCLTAKITAAIYWQAMKLWWKGVPFVPHPRRAADRRTLESRPQVVTTVGDKAAKSFWLRS
jgi:hypothetical protein